MFYIFIKVNQQFLTFKLGKGGKIHDNLRPFKNEDSLDKKPINWYWWLLSQVALALTRTSIYRVNYPTGVIHDQMTHLLSNVLTLVVNNFGESSATWMTKIAGKYHSGKRCLKIRIFASLCFCWSTNRWFSNRYNFDVLSKYEKFFTCKNNNTAWVFENAYLVL